MSDVDAMIESDAPREVIEVRRDQTGALDEIVAKDCFVHLERMGPNVWWLSIEKGGYRQCVWLRARGRIEAHTECDESEPQL